MGLHLKSMLFDSTASGIFAGTDSFAITIWTVFEFYPHNRSKPKNFIFVRFVLAVAINSMLHDVSLTYIYNALADYLVYKFLAH